MKKFIVFIFTFFLSVSVYSQLVTIQDNSSLNPVTNAKLISGTITLTTNVMGQTDITELKGADKIIISASDYITQTLSYEKIKSDELYCYDDRQKFQYG